MAFIEIHSKMVVIDLQANKVSNFLFIYLFFIFSPSVLANFKISIFEIPIVLQTLKTNHLKTRSAKPIHLNIIRRVTKYSSKICPKGNVYYYCFWDIAVCIQVGISTRVQRGALSKIVKFSLKLKNLLPFWKFLHKWPIYILRRFQVAFNFFILFNPFSSKKKKKNFNFEITIIP